MRHAASTLAYGEAAAAYVLLRSVASRPRSMQPSQQVRSASVHRTKLLSVPLSIGRRSPTKIFIVSISELTRQAAGDLLRLVDFGANILLYTLS